MGCNTSSERYSDIFSEAELSVGGSESSFDDFLSRHYRGPSEWIEIRQSGFGNLELPESADEVVFLRNPKCRRPSPIVTVVTISLAGLADESESDYQDDFAAPTEAQDLDFRKRLSLQKRMDSNE